MGERSALLAIVLLLFSIPFTLASTQVLSLQKSGENYLLLASFDSSSPATLELTNGSIYSLTRGKTGLLRPIGLSFSLTSSSCSNQLSDSGQSVYQLSRTTVSNDECWCGNKDSYFCANVNHARSSYGDPLSCNRILDSRIQRYTYVYIFRASSKVFSIKSAASQATPTYSLSLSLMDTSSSSIQLNSTDAKSFSSTASARLVSNPNIDCSSQNFGPLLTSPNGETAEYSQPYLLAYNVSYNQYLSSPSLASLDSAITSFTQLTATKLTNSGYSPTSISRPSSSPPQFDPIEFTFSGDPFYDIPAASRPSTNLTILTQGNLSISFSDSVKGTRFTRTYAIRNSGSTDASASLDFPLPGDFSSDLAVRVNGQSISIASSIGTLHFPVPCSASSTCSASIDFTILGLNYDFAEPEITESVVGKNLAGNSILKISSANSVRAMPLEIPPTFDGWNVVSVFPSVSSVAPGSSTEVVANLARAGAKECGREESADSLSVCIDSPIFIYSDTFIELDFSELKAATNPENISVSIDSRSAPISPGNGNEKIRINLGRLGGGKHELKISYSGATAAKKDAAPANPSQQNPTPAASATPANLSLVFHDDLTPGKNISFVAYLNGKRASGTLSFISPGGEIQQANLTGGTGVFYADEAGVWTASMNHSSKTFEVLAQENGSKNSNLKIASNPNSKPNEKENSLFGINIPLQSLMLIFLVSFLFLVAASYGAFVYLGTPKATLEKSVLGGHVKLRLKNGSIPFQRVTLTDSIPAESAVINQADGDTKDTIFGKVIAWYIEDLPAGTAWSAEYLVSGEASKKPFKFKGFSNSKQFVFSSSLLEQGKQVDCKGNAHQNEKAADKRTLELRDKHALEHHDSKVTHADDSLGIGEVPFKREIAKHGANQKAGKGVKHPSVHKK
ncbi:Uncharacterised protein [Candidatus Gugararchaeum adminiculabundum]|nr:Uncharacterised protein [Candidatus Gugararchaeum adminiculabundum]